MNQVENYGLQETIRSALIEHPDWRGHLEEMVANELAGRDKAYYQGWEADEVHCNWTIMSQMLPYRIVDSVSRSRAFHHYKLHSLEDTRQVLAELSTRGAARADTPVNPDSMFELVVGHERAKRVLRDALGADDPVHVLLVGPPGTAKSLMLSEIGNLPGAEWYMMSSTTKSGLLGLLMQNKPRYLVIDELDKGSSADMTPLLSLMETGTVSVLHSGVQKREQMKTWVFAGANDVKYLGDAWRSRFVQIDIAPYTPEQFVMVAQAVLTKQVGCGPEVARLVANAVVQHSRDIRKAISVAKMCKRDPRKIVAICDAIWPGGSQSKITALPKQGG